MRKSLILRIFLAMFFSAIWPALTLAQNQNVANLADQVQKAYENIQDLQIQFDQSTYVAILEKQVQKTGSIKIKKPGKFLIQYQGNSATRYVSNGKKLWVFREGDRQVQSYPVDDQNVPAEALSFLGGLSSLKKDFAVEEVDEKKWATLKQKANPNLLWMELTPLKKLSQIDWMILGFDPKTFLSQELYLFTDSGNLTYYRFSKIEKNQGLAEDLFDFKQADVKEISH